MAGVTSVPNCTAAIGTLTFDVGTAIVATINTDTNQITAEQPGTTVITASMAGSGSSAGYFSTCPPASIIVTLANGGTTGDHYAGRAAELTTTVLTPTTSPSPAFTGLPVDRSRSTSPSASAGAPLRPTFPGGLGLCHLPAAHLQSVAHQRDRLRWHRPFHRLESGQRHHPGTASDYVWFAAPGQSQYFVPIELLTGTVGSTVRLPYVPNSMVMDSRATIFISARPAS